jgi:hypothetical protein
MNTNARKVKGAKTRNGKPVWINDENDEPYSEKSMSFEYGDGQLVTPTIDPTTGERYNLDKLFEHYKENGPYDIFTGEKLPVFEDISTADEYSKWRSDNIFNFNLSEQEFYAGESDLYSKQDGSDTSWADRKQDMIDLAAGARDKVYDVFGISEDEKTGFALGGLAVANKGITTVEGQEMAKNKFQLDRKKADKNGDGKLSKYEETTGEAVQKAMDDDELIEMAHGGMACGMMSDPESGNEIPMGSSAENVRDDIEVMISEGEYVLPANVVKWHGLKHIMDMQSEAEMGLMSMYDTGLIQYTDEEGAEEPEEVEAAETDAPEEDIEVEVATVEVDDKLDDDEETEEISPRTSNLPSMMQRKSYAFIS